MILATEAFPWYGWLIVAGVALATLALCAVSAWMIGDEFDLHPLRKVFHGRHRQTETNHPHPNDLAIQAWFAKYGTLAGYPLSPWTPAPSPDPGLTMPDIVDEDTPILAHRGANIVIANNRMMFASLNGGGLYSSGPMCFENDGDAYCHCGPHGGSIHPQAPAYEGSCGFYAVPLDMPGAGGTVDLLVELSGIVIEHEAGYRAAHQTVIECRIPPCPYCAQPANLFLFANGQLCHVGCDAHFPIKPDAPWVKVNREDFTRAIGVPVTDLEPGKQLRRPA